MYPYEVIHCTSNKKGYDTPAAATTKGIIIRARTNTRLPVTPTDFFVCSVAGPGSRRIKRAYLPKPSLPQPHPVGNYTTANHGSSVMGCHAIDRRDPQAHR